MAVYKKTYKPYEGSLSSSWRRFLVIPRYAFEDLYRSKFLTIFFLASFIQPLVAAIIIYVQHNAAVFNLVGAQGANRLISINVTFFMSNLGWQSMLALFLASPHTETLPRLLWEHLQQTITPVIAAVATLVLLFTLVLMAAVSLLRRSDTQAA